MNNKLLENIIEITPWGLRCIAAACPSIFKIGNKSYVVIGKMLTIEELTEEMKNKVGEGEIAVEVPRELFSELQNI